MENTEYVLKTDNLTKMYNGVKVVNAVNMHVKKGDIYGFIGKNGAGKTTFMRMVAGLAAPIEGSIELFGSTDVDVQRKRIGTLIENPGIYPNMTAKDNLEIVRRTFGVTDKGIVDEMLKLVGLQYVGKKKVKDFSMGMKQRLGLAIALLRNPDFLILDEPTSGLDPEGIRETRDLLLKLNKEKHMTILISSHILGELSKMATRYGIIKNGALIEEFGADELADRCKRCLKLEVDNTALATNILETKLAITEYDVPAAGEIRVFERIRDVVDINQALIEGGVGITKSYTAGKSLEDCFMDLLEAPQGKGGN
ncbi:MAG: ATP-binding cassette domain-containing protein [Lachnospiraceae bacterium]|nr:ATP-binding cassette domain-containing protein [Lachnospiraceae bacterium]